MFISKDKPLRTQLKTSQIQSLINGIKDKNQTGYYDLVAMGLVNKQIDTPFTEGLDKEVAKVIEYYMEYGDLLLLSKHWGSELLRKTVKTMTIESIGTKMNLLEVTPHFEGIKDVLSITPESLLNEMAKFEESISDITIDNIEKQIPKYTFYNYSSETKNKLTDHINNIAVEKLKTIPEDELFANCNANEYYWLNCASILIKNNILKTLPNNLTNLIKKVLVEIAAGRQAIPESGSILENIINKANKNKLQPTVKRICDDYCNKIKTITPTLFVYFANNFDFINKMKHRSDDITRNIINNVFLDPNCQDIILDDSSGYIKKINEAGNDAEDLKVKIRELLKDNPTDKLKDFASAIDVKVDSKNE